jgi:LysM repeat protein
MSCRGYDRGGMAGWRNPARYLAPLALAATVGATYVIVHRALVAKDTTTTSSAVQELTGLHTHPTSTKAEFYVAQPNDTLSGIAARTGVSVAVLESLNPTINPSALQPSERLRLRR